MGPGALPIVLVFLLVFFSWRTVYTANSDLVRVKAWKELARRAMPFGALLIMALSLFIVQSYRESWVLVTWMIVSGAVIVLSSVLTMSGAERRANRAFRSGNYERAAELYGELVEEKPLARNHAFLGAALGAAGHKDSSISASTTAVQKDPKYGLAYYNRALVLIRQEKKSRAVKDLRKSLEVDLPRRFRSNARKILKDLD